MKSRVPPHNLEAESALLGALMMDPNSWDSIADLVSESDFYRSANRKIFSAIRDLQLKQQPSDLVVVSNYLQSKGELDAIGANYLVEIYNQFPVAANIRSYAQIVREKALLRSVINTSTEIVEQAYEAQFESVEGFLDEVEGKIFALAEHKQDKQGLLSAHDIVKLSLDRIEVLSKQTSLITGVPTGFEKIDHMTAGFQPGELIIVAARPSMGKTALGLNMAVNAALRHKKKIAFFSLEMAKEQIMMRLLASEAQIDIHDIKLGKIPHQAWPRLINAATELSESGLFIDDTSAISPFDIRAKCRRLKAQHGLDMIMIDYLQIMDLKMRMESRERMIAEISRMLKALAKELHMPVVALAQLNRGVEGRGDRRPILSDLRESGSIEQDADLIMMIYRDEYYEKDKSEQKGVAEIIVGKHRNGPTGVVKLAWRSQYGIFANLAEEGLVPPPSPQPVQMRHGSGSEHGKVRNFAHRPPEPPAGI